MSDARIRDLERRAAQGDPDAASRLKREQRRAAGPKACRLGQRFALSSFVVCPECKGRLAVNVSECDADTGEPTAVEVDCLDDMDEEEAAAMQRLGAGGTAHRWSQADWQSVRDRLLAWARRCLFVEGEP